ncbi:MAG: SOS response-associated peptidase [Candidatus Marinimicrobia bacterium]|nr:SOS response-associated peptidase [Candidatus Neomarinimicrobiota bacterium]
MCFNISINSNKQAIEKQFDAEFHTDFEFMSNSHISAFTNPKIPAITSEDSNLIQPVHWGLIPHWVKDKEKADSIRKMTYNAKSETIHEKPSFRDSFKESRCLVIADGFYEWQSTSSGKICHYITSNESNLFAFAGIFSEWTDKLSGEYIKSASIITQSANPVMAKIHNIKKRQPVILTNDVAGQWLNKNIEFEHILNNAFNIDLKSEIVRSPLKR